MNPAAYPFENKVPYWTGDFKRIAKALNDARAEYKRVSSLVVSVTVAYTYRAQH